MDLGATPLTRASTMTAALEALGLDPANLPAFADLMAEIEAAQDRDRLVGVMRVFTSALGVRCNGCHTVAGPDGRPDFAAVTRNKQIAAQMWDRFAVGLKRQDGGAQFCRILATKGPQSSSTAVTCVSSVRG